MATTEAAPLDAAKLEQFVFRAVDEVGATLNAALVVMGDRLGLYRALAGAGPLTPAELAERTGTAERYVREWLNAQAAGGYVAYEPADGRYHLPPEQTVALTDEDSPAYLPGFFEIALGSVLDSPRITAAARAGERRRLARAQPPRPRRLRALLPPRLQRQPRRRVAARPRRRRRAARARRRASPTSAAATASRRSSWRSAFPNSTFVGSDYHAGSIETARRRASEAGVEDRVTLRGRAGGRATAAADYDLVTMFDCLHDMGDPVGAAAARARHARARTGRG